LLAELEGLTDAENVRMAADRRPDHGGTGTLCSNNHEFSAWLWHIAQSLPAGSNATFGL
jgi:hypothetical protein